MSKGVNKVIILGNVGQDPETKFTASGTAIANLSVATSESWKDKQTGQQVDKTEWHRVVAFNRLAEIIGEYVKKGSKVYIEGKITTRKWQDQGGADRYTTEIVASEMQMLSAKSGQVIPASEYGLKPQQQSQEPRQPTPDQAESMNNFDDHIPF